MTRIQSVKVATVLCPLPTPIAFGPWVMRHREFALVRIASDTGHHGLACCYTRDAPVAEIVRRSIAPLYVGADVSDPRPLHWAAAWSNNAILASGLATGRSRPWTSRCGI